MVRGSKSTASQAQNRTVSIAVPPAANPQRLRQSKSSQHSHPQGGSNSEEEFDFAPVEANKSGSEHDVGSQSQTQLTSKSSRKKAHDIATLFKTKEIEHEGCDTKTKVKVCVWCG
jgi:hypothetical protein